jgi:hypothetical protein
VAESVLLILGVAAVVALLMAAAVSLVLLTAGEVEARPMVAEKAAVAIGLTGRRLYDLSEGRKMP